MPHVLLFFFSLYWQCNWVCNRKWIGSEYLIYSKQSELFFLLNSMWRNRSWAENMIYWITVKVVNYNKIKQKREITWKQKIWSISRNKKTDILQYLVNSGFLIFFLLSRISYFGRILVEVVWSTSLPHHTRGSERNCAPALHELVSAFEQTFHTSAEEMEQRSRGKMGKEEKREIHTLLPATFDQRVIQAVVAMQQSQWVALVLKMDSEMQVLYKNIQQTNTEPKNST